MSDECLRCRGYRRDIERMKLAQGAEADPEFYTYWRDVVEDQAARADRAEEERDLLRKALELNDAAAENLARELAAARTQLQAARDLLDLGIPLAEFWPRLRAALGVPTEPKEKP